MNSGKWEIYTMEMQTQKTQRLGARRERKRLKIFPSFDLDKKHKVKNLSSFDLDENTKL